ncbi:CD1375 family protein [Cohnella nanjingensis]|nr:CD1375 family protein [Cohnella nanjingensis]
MAQVYANLIRRGIKTIEDVPENKREEVQAILNADA